MKRITWCGPAIFLAITTQLYAQTTLTQVFNDLRSPDPKIREHAQKVGPQVLESELPHISVETTTLCSTLTDNDPYMRMQASAVLATVTALYPQESNVVSTCYPNLIKTASDNDRQVKLNSLLSLSFNQGGPPAGAAPAFEAAIADPDSEVKQLGATGIMRLPSGASQAAVRELTEQLTGSADPEATAALLLGIAQSQRTNDKVAQASATRIADKNSSVQANAVLAFEAASPDKASALNRLQNYLASGALTGETKQMAEAAVARLQQKQLSSSANAGGGTRSGTPSPRTPPQNKAPKNPQLPLAPKYRDHSQNGTYSRKQAFPSSTLSTPAENLKQGANGTEVP